MEIEDLEENAGDDNLFGLDDSDDEENTSPKTQASIPARPKKTFPISRQKPENISIGQSVQNIPRKRGRPAGSGKSNQKSTTNVEGGWIVGIALALNLSTGIMAAKVFNDQKYLMTKPEAEAAAKGIVYVLFQYKQIREFATMVNPNSNYYVLAKAFWPYLSRVFMKELMENVISGFFVPAAGRQSNRKSKSTGNESRQSNSGNDGTNNSNHDGFTGNISASRIIDWRDVG